MLAKQLTFMTDAEAVGIGRCLPIILSSRADSANRTLASCAAAALLTDAVKDTAGGKNRD